MSSALDHMRWTVGLAFVVTMGGCGRTNDQLGLQFNSEPKITDSADQYPPSPDSIPSTRNSLNTETMITEQIAAEFALLLDMRVQCGRKPASCPIHQMTAPDSTYRKYLARLMKIRADANLATREGAGQFRFRIDSIRLLSSHLAVVHTCIFDSLVVFDAGRSESTGDDIVFDDDVISGHTKWQVVSHDGKWKWSDASGVDTTYGRDICGFVS